MRVTRYTSYDTRATRQLSYTVSKACPGYIYTCKIRDMERMRIGTGAFRMKAASDVCSDAKSIRKW